MKNFSKTTLLTLFIALTNYCYGLEIDEKLTLRILEVSQSKKTVLVNRGLEDGLVLGDHAKFFLTKGVVARGVVVKASPSRSIWSIYRIIDGDDIAKNNVLNIKISTAVRLTDDPTKSVNDLASDDSELGEPGDIVATKKSGQLSMNNSDDSEVSSLLSDKEFTQAAPNISKEEKIEIVRSSKTNHGLEVYSLLSMSALSGTYTTETTEYDAKNSNMNFSIGLEKYFASSTSLLKNISLKIYYSIADQSSGANGYTTTRIDDMGAGLSYYFGNGPFQTNKMLYFADVNFGLTTATLTTTPVSGDVTELAGSGSHISFGLGAKYLFGKEFGAIAKLDYYQSTTSFEIEENSTIVNEDLAVAGPRVMMGLSYRFW